MGLDTHVYKAMEQREKSSSVTWNTGNPGGVNIPQCHVSFRLNEAQHSPTFQDFGMEEPPLECRGARLGVGGAGQVLWSKCERAMLMVPGGMGGRSLVSSCVAMRLGCGKATVNVKVVEDPGTDSAQIPPPRRETCRHVRCNDICSTIQILNHFIYKPK